MVIFLILFLVLKLLVGQDECTLTTCLDHGLTIRFPFRLNNRQPQHCGCPDFDLSCSQTNDTVLDLPFSVKVLINYINYTSQSIHIIDPYGCFPHQLRNLNLFSSPFQFSDFSLFNSSISSLILAYSVALQKGNNSIAIPTLAANRVVKLLLFTLIFLSTQSLLFCIKMCNIPSIPSEVFDQTPDLQLKWPKQICDNCEVQEKYCRLNISYSMGHENFKLPKEGESKKPRVIAGVVVCSFLLVIVVIALYCVHRSKKIKREDQSKIERFLEDYKALKPSRYSYADIKKITNQFTNKVGQGGYGTVYRGQLSNDVHVAVKILNSSKRKREDFINEMGIIGRIHHINVVCLVGYCADGGLEELLFMNSY